MIGKDTRFKKGNPGGPGRPKGPGRPHGWNTRGFVIAELEKVDPTDPKKRKVIEVMAAALVLCRDPEEILALFKWLDGLNPPAKELDGENAKPEGGGIVVPSIDARHASFADRCEVEVGN